MKTGLLILLLSVTYSSGLTQSRSEQLPYYEWGQGNSKEDVRLWTQYFETADLAFFPADDQLFQSFPQKDWMTERVFNSGRIYWLRLNVKNTHRSDTLFLPFFTGLHAKITLFERSSVEVQYQKVADAGAIVLNPEFDWLADAFAVPIIIPPLEERQYLLRVQDYYIMRDQIRADLFSPEGYRVYGWTLLSKQMPFLIFLGLVIGGLSILSMYMIFQFVFTRYKAFLWYGFYLFLATLFFINVLEMYSNTKWVSGFIPSFSLKVIPVVYVLKLLSYLIFLWFFLDLKKEKGVLKRIIRLLIVVNTLFVVMLIIYFNLGNVENSNLTSWQVNRFFGAILFQIPVIGVLILKYYTKPIKIFFGLGLFFLLSGAIISFIMNQFILVKPIQDQAITECPSFYYGLFSIMESLCFALSLGYKMRLLEQEKHLLTLENELEKQRLRIQIARDLHDEVGSSVGSITLYIKRLKMISGKSATDVQAVLDQINLIALKTSQALNDAIWSIDARKESYSDLVLRVKEYAQPLAEANDMRCKIEVDLPEGKVSTIFKRNVWLILKESINNAVKHSGSDSLVIKIVIRGSSFMASIMDKGVGFDPKKIRAEGNGLQNIDSRASELGGSVQIQTEKGRGTAVVLTIPINEK